MPFPDYSPWGKVQTSKQLCESAYQVSTASHGGIMVLRTAVNDLLSPIAQQYGFVDGAWHCYEEDCDAPIPIRELLDKGLYTAPVNQYYGPGEYSAAIDDSLKHFHPRYWDLHQKSQALVNINLRTMTLPEQMYCYPQSHQLSMQTGLIGHLQVDMGSDGTAFSSTFFDFLPGLKTSEFRSEFDGLIQALRTAPQYEEILKDRRAMTDYCRRHEEKALGGLYRAYGIRADTKMYTYLLRMNPNREEDDLHCYCYLKQWFDRHLERAEQGIRFIDPHYKELFRIPDGDTIRITGRDGNCRDWVCRYIDEIHFELGTVGKANLYHICQFAERLRDNGSREIIPLRSSLPQKCFSVSNLSGELIAVEKGCMGYTPVRVSAEGMTARESADILNDTAGVTKAQEAAMVAGSMFGWATPAADPKNYDNQGMPVRPRHKDRRDAR